MKIQEALYDDFCKNGCPYNSNRKEYEDSYKKMEPCLNCPAEAYDEWIEDRTKGKTIHIESIETLHL